MSSKNSKGETYGKGRTRNYCTIVYPDSVPENWQDIISELHVQVFISPLHDKDVTANNEPKKAHYHVLLVFDSVKTKEQAQDVISTFNGVGCECVNSLRSYARYLCHLDDPNKAQYQIDDVKCFGGADYIATIGTAADKAKSIKEMIQYIEENDIICFAELAQYCSIERSDWFDTLINSGAYFIKEYIKSRTWKMHHIEEK